MACRFRIRMLLLGACCWPTATVEAQRARTASAPSGSRAPVTLTYLGTAGWEITNGSTVILVDPYLSRVRLPMSGSSLGRAAGAAAPPVDQNFVLMPDSAAVDAHVRRADFIILHHAHFDHILDVPYIARKTGGVRPDVVLAGAAASRGDIYDYTRRLMRALGSPAVVLPTHWDNYFLPFDAPQDTAVARLADLVREVHTASPRTRVIIPKYFVPVVIPPSSK